MIAKALSPLALALALGGCEPPIPPAAVYVSAPRPTPPCIVPSLNVPIDTAPRATGGEVTGPGFLVREGSPIEFFLLGKLFAATVDANGRNGPYSPDLSASNACAKMVAAALNKMPHAAAVEVIRFVAPGVPVTAWLGQPTPSSAPLAIGENSAIDDLREQQRRDQEKEEIEEDVAHRLEVLIPDCTPRGCY